MQRLSIVLAAGIALSFGLLSLAGGRDCVGFLSGTMPASGLEVLLGLAYAAAYFATVLAVPVLALVPMVARWRSPSRR